MLVEHLVFVVYAVDSGLGKIGRCNVTVEILVGECRSELCHSLATAVAEGDESNPGRVPKSVFANFLHCLAYKSLVPLVRAL